MDTNSVPANIDSLFGSEPANPASPPVAAPSPELAPVTIPVGPDPNVDPSQVPQPVPAAPPPAPVPAPQPQAHMVPLPELLDTRRRAQAAEAAVQQMQQQMQFRDQQYMEALQRLQYAQQPPPQPIDPVAEPERAFQTLAQKNAELEHHIRTLPQAILQQVQEQSKFERLRESEYRAREVARTKYGNDTIVDQAVEAAGQAGLDKHFAAQRDPHGAAVSWYLTQQFAQRVGTDPAAYEAQVEARARERIIAEMRQGRQPSNIPPSITSATNSASAPNVVASSRDFFNGFANEPLRKRQQ
jgi:hypothetical protein